MKILYNIPIFIVESEWESDVKWLNNWPNWLPEKNQKQSSYNGQTNVAASKSLSSAVRIDKITRLLWFPCEIRRAVVNSQKMPWAGPIISEWPHTDDESCMFTVSKSFEPPMSKRSRVTSHCTVWKTKNQANFLTEYFVLFILLTLYLISSWPAPILTALTVITDGFIVVIVQFRLWP